MFTGIIKSLGEVSGIVREGSNLHLRIASDMADELQIDESVSHNGVCLTVVAVDEGEYTVTAIRETLNITNLDSLKLGEKVNLERAMLSGSRLDGHIVQGHVDCTGALEDIWEAGGSWYFRIGYELTPGRVLVNKGSICVNGVSLTVIEPDDKGFSVAIIPYTYEHTTFQYLQPGDRVNLEFDVLGKYIAKYIELYLPRRG